MVELEVRIGGDGTKRPQHRSSCKSKQVVGFLENETSVAEKIGNFKATKVGPTK